MTEHARPTEATARGMWDRLPTPKLTIIVPTFERRHLLAECLESLLAQDADDLVVRVHDNASTDGTPHLVRSIEDSRLDLRVNATNVGLFRNWHRALGDVETPYVAIVSDDDLWHAGYARAAIDALDAHPSAALAFGDVELIDELGQTTGRRRVPLPTGCFEGLDYLERVVGGENIIVDSSATVIRTSALRAVGGLDAPHMNHDIIFDYQFRLAARHDIVRIPSSLVSVRVHPDQSHRDTDGVLAAIGMVGERMDAVAHLLESHRAIDPSYRTWLAGRARFLGQLRSQYTADALPGLNDPAEYRLELAVDDLLAATDPDDVIAVAGSELLHHDRLSAARSLRPFPEIDGHSTGPPENDDDAVRAVDRSLGDGCDVLAFAWPSFWWLDFYCGLRSFLADQHPPVVANSRVIIHPLMVADGPAPVGRGDRGQRRRP